MGQKIKKEIRYYYKLYYNENDNKDVCNSAKAIDR